MSLEDLPYEIHTLITELIIPTSTLVSLCCVSRLLYERTISQLYCSLAIDFRCYDSVAKFFTCLLRGASIHVRKYTKHLIIREASERTRNFRHARAKVFEGRDFYTSDFQILVRLLLECLAPNSLLSFSLLAESTVFEILADLRQSQTSLLRLQAPLYSSEAYPHKHLQSLQVPFENSETAASFLSTCRRQGLGQQLRMLHIAIKHTKYDKIFPAAVQDIATTTNVCMFPQLKSLSLKGMCLYDCAGAFQTIFNMFSLTALSLRENNLTEGFLSELSHQPGASGLALKYLVVDFGGSLAIEVQDILAWIFRSGSLRHLHLSFSVPCSADFNVPTYLESASIHFERASEYRHVAHLSHVNEKFFRGLLSLQCAGMQFDLAEASSRRPENVLTKMRALDIAKRLGSMPKLRLVHFRHQSWKQSPLKDLAYRRRLQKYIALIFKILRTKNLCAELQYIVVGTYDVSCVPQACFVKGTVMDLAICIDESHLRYIEGYADILDIAPGSCVNEGMPERMQRMG